MASIISRSRSDSHASSGGGGTHSSIVSKVDSISPVDSFLFLLRHAPRFVRPAVPPCGAGGWDIIGLDRRGALRGHVGGDGGAVRRRQALEDAPQRERRLRERHRFRIEHEQSARRRAREQERREQSEHIGAQRVAVAARE